MKKAFLFTPALLALSISAISNAHAYNNTYVFGDSLSDSGNNGRYTIDGKTSQLYAEYVAQHITGSKPTASKDGGTNYAQGGATAISSLNPEKPEDNTTEQIKKYLAAHNNRADANGVYIHWIGGNDLAAALIAGQPTGDSAEAREKGAKIAHDIVNNSATAAGEQINLLVNAGAGLIIAPTAPDVGITPRLLETVLRGALQTKGKSQDDINAILQEVRAGINEYPTPNNEVRDLVLEGALKKIAAKTTDPAETEALLLAAYGEARKGATNLTDAYNKLVDEKISQSNGNIMRVDANGLLKEVIANPLVYGISNTLGYACSKSLSDAECSSKDPKFDINQSFLFADSLHPTPLGHLILGQYIESIYNAPSQVMTLNQVNRIPVKGVRASLDGHLQQLRNGGNAQGKIGIFGGYTGSHNNTFTLGGDYQLTDNLLLGAVYSNYKDERTSASNFTHEGRAHVVTTYTLWNFYDKGWLSGDLHYSNNKYDSLTRSIQLGQATRRETGSTTGKQWGGRLTAGWDIAVTNQITTSPIIQYAWDKGDIKGYRESGNNRTSMHFADQDYTSKVGTLGWRVDTQLGRINPYASVQFNHEFGDTRYKLRSAINSTKTSFVQESGKQNTDWRQYTVGVNANLFNNWRGFASVTRNESNSQEHNYNFSLGINASF
ncbi:autotransporter domain-containing esterase [Xenorhabdus bovienii]|uniref:autotransporter domain-containing esterase n=1 Tax=Xenorhabdus bovienii TaxID=40576 RepID=UPI0004D46BB1|nr:autotransporter domain-containing esterase [Xenorhabdus bovienii]CDG87402.1 Lipase 1 precursor (Triacylglycerol lipase) [Xenorhabdus bovienii str. feltiae France]CDG94997.1 Lipase 1 precursor (Triacylglycerol lipase) [Xenorhabdus bovienii str. feltiae Florida]